MSNDYLSFNPEEVDRSKVYDINYYKGYQTDMFGSLYIPSTVHSYSLGVEYLRDWFIEKFQKDYFKTVFINGRHMMQDYMKYSTISLIKREKPAVAITPNPDMEYDRETQDLYMGGRDMYIKKYNHNQGFFKDFDNNVFLGMNVRTQKINFNIRVRVESRAQQLDLYRYMEVACRIGFTHKEFISADFHIPMELIVNIARNAGFEIDEVRNKNGDVIQQLVVDNVNFLKYMNNHSEFPVICKLRGVSGLYEYFIRVDRVYCHIDTTDKLGLDEGTREGHLDNNFQIDMNCVLSIWVPSFYVFKTAKPLFTTIQTLDSNEVGLWTCKILEIPEINSRGWNKYMNVDYEFDREELQMEKVKIDISGFFSKPDMKMIIKDSIERGISPSKFIEVAIVNLNYESDCKINWDEFSIEVTNCKSNKVTFVLYLDYGYYNTQMEIKKKANETRLS